MELQVWFLWHVKEMSKLGMAREPFGLILLKRLLDDFYCRAHIALGLYLANLRELTAFEV